MTDTEALADVVVAAVRAATAPLLERLAVLEARAPVPGPAGERGDQGAPGVVDPTGLAAVTARLDQVTVQVTALEARDGELSGEEVIAAMSDLLRKELAIEPARMQRRILRADGSELGRVVDAPAT